MKILVPTILMLVLFSCLESTDPRLGDEFELAFSQTSQIDNENIVIKFVGVSEDSRCPTNVNCIWAGNAKILLEIFQDTLSINTALEPKNIEVNGYQIELKSVSPYPNGIEAVNIDDYSIGIVVTK